MTDYKLTFGSQLAFTGQLEKQALLKIPAARVIAGPATGIRVQDGKADIATTRDVWDLTTLISGYTLGPPIVHLLATALALPGPHFPVALAGATVGFGLGRIRWWWIHRP